MELPCAALVATIAVSGDLDHVQVAVQAARPGVVFGHGGAELDRLRAELEELTGKPVRLNMRKYDGPPKGRKEIQTGPELTAD
jgi:small subunit ribosomal protein S3